MIDKKWKWVAKDENDQVYVFKERPVLVKEQLIFVWRTKETTEWCPCTSLIPLPESYRDSLHEIIHHEDGKIEFRKARPELKVDDPVFVRDFPDEDWMPRHFFGWTTDGRVMTFPHGTSSFTIKESDLFEPTTWEQYKLP